MNTYAILLSGDITITQRLRKQLIGCTIIAADSGIRHADQLDLPVDLWVGDFDSASASLQRGFADVPREEWSANKDLTDGEIAIAAAYRKGAQSIILVGAMGGRTDHATNHILKSFNMSGRVMLTSGKEEGMPIRGEITTDWQSGTEFSVLAFDDLQGLTIKGAKWPLDNVYVQYGSGWTISNVVDGELKITLKSGRAFLIGNLG